MDIPRQSKKKTKPYVYAGLGVAALIAVSVVVARLGPAAPSVDRNAVFADSVARGTMLIQVRGPGTLVPEQIRWVSSLTAGRIERKLVQPGSQVTPSTTIVEMSNPDVQLEALEAERQLTQAESERVNLRAALETDRLNQRGVVASIRAQYEEALRTATAAESLAKRGLTSRFELEDARGRARELETRIDVEEQRLTVMSESMEAQLHIQDSQVERMRSIVEFQRQRLASMRVLAGMNGVLQDLPLEEGQWVTPGATLARVVQPERLKAVLRIPEVQARDVALGQRAFIDTRRDTIPGRVVRIDPAAQGGTVSVDVALDLDTLPRGARPDLSVDGTIEIARLDDVFYTSRPVFGQAHSTVGLFKVVEDGDAAVRVQVSLGAASVNTVQVLGGLTTGDVVILSDMSQWEDADRLRLR